MLSAGLLFEVDARNSYDKISDNHYAGLRRHQLHPRSSQETKSENVIQDETVCWPRNTSHAKYEYPNSKSLSACVTFLLFLVYEIDLVILRCSWQGIGKKNIYTVAAVWFFFMYILDSRCLDPSRN